MQKYTLVIVNSDRAIQKKTVQIHFFNHIVDNSFKNYKQIRCLQPIND